MFWIQLPLFFSENRWALMFRDLFIIVDTNYKPVSHGLGLSEAVGMAKMNHVITTGKQKNPTVSDKFKTW